MLKYHINSKQALMHQLLLQDVNKLVTRVSPFPVVLPF